MMVMVMMSHSVTSCIPVDPASRVLPRKTPSLLSCPACLVPPVVSLLGRSARLVILSLAIYPAAGRGYSCIEEVSQKGIFFVVYCFHRKARANKKRSSSGGVSNHQMIMSCKVRHHNHPSIINRFPSIFLFSSRSPFVASHVREKTRSKGRFLHPKSPLADEVSPKVSSKEDSSRKGKDARFSTTHACARRDNHCSRSQGARPRKAKMHIVIITIVERFTSLLHQP